MVKIRQIARYKKDDGMSNKEIIKTLKNIGFLQFQKSVFIHPYECKDEVNFIVEIFDLAPYVRFLRVKNIDIEFDLRNKFRLI